MEQTYLDTVVPPLAEDLVIRALDDGRHVVKNPRKQSYLQLGPQESFLLRQLDGQGTARDVVRSFEQQFAEPLSGEELREFVEMASKEGLVADARRSSTSDDGLWTRMRKQIRKQSLLFFRVKLFDPDRLLNWLEPRTRWLFSPGLAAAAVLGTLAALLLTWLNREQLISQFASNFTWRTLAVAWLTTIVVTVCHEFGHGLACKRYGGEVHEMGALWIFLTPCLYCNVSDAWLLSSKWRRLLISMAGTYVDLLIWIPSVFLWRVTAPDTALNYSAWIVATTCGVRVAFNINPLIRMDGYYAISDVLEIPNLRRRARARWMDHVRWLLWGAERPQRTPQGRALLTYGICSWVFTVGLLSLLYFNITGLLKSMLGVAGVIGGATLFIGVSKRYFQGSLGGEFAQMIRMRRKRLTIWLVLAVGLLLIPVRARVGGTFQVRPALRWEVRAPVAGFLREVRANEGDSVSAGGTLARLEVPELASQITRKQAEITESRAKLKRLQAGPRPEEVQEQREKVSRDEHWRDLAIHDLQKAREGLQQDLARLQSEVEQSRLEVQYQSTMLEQSQQLYKQGGLAGQQLMSQKKRALVAKSQQQQAEAAIRARQASGVLEAEAEQARREKNLADTRAVLSLLLAGSRPEDIEAEQASLSRLQEEIKHLQSLQAKQKVEVPFDGVVTTPRMNEKVGQFLEKGVVICVIEDLQQLEAEIAVDEEDARVLAAGQEVLLKPRSLPFHRLSATADRVAPSATGFTATGQSPPQQTRHTVTVYCHLENDDDGILRSGMTGYGRIYQGVRPLGWIIATRLVRLVRTEFWW